jgi:hypothetical protein
MWVSKTAAPLQLMGQEPQTVGSLARFGAASSCQVVPTARGATQQVMENPQTVF